MHKTGLTSRPTGLQSPWMYTRGPVIALARAGGSASSSRPDHGDRKPSRMKDTDGYRDSRQDSQPARGRGAPSGGRGFGGRGGRGGPPAPPQGISRTQRQLLSGLDRLREEIDDDSDDEEGPTNRRGTLGRGQRDGSGSRSGSRKPGSRDDGPSDFVIIQSSRSKALAAERMAAAAATAASGAASAASGAADEELDGSRFWREASGWDSDDEDEEGEEEEEEGEEMDEDEGLPEVPETEEQLQLRTLYTSAGKTPARTLDTGVRFQTVRGRGRGLVATSAIELGRLILVSQPLGILYCDEGSTPENEELADHMLTKCKLTQPQQALLTWLHDGSSDKAGEGSGKAGPGGELVASHERLEAAFAAAASKGAAQPISMPSEQFYKVVNTNCIGEEFQDITICALRGEDSLGHLGLWPEAAMINHSCAPNATCFTIGDHLVVRATEDIAGGTEVTLNWVGALLTAPLQQRRTELQDKYNFTCECKRCKAEAALAGTPVEAAVTSTYKRCQGLAPRLEAAIEGGSKPELVAVSSELEQLRASLEEAIRVAKVASKTKAWLQASAYDLYDMMSLAADEGAWKKEEEAQQRPGGRRGGRGPSREEEEEVLDTERLAWCVRILNQVARGTDAHIYLTAELMMRTVNKFGEQHQEALNAISTCKESYQARYGPISSRLFEELAAARLNV